MPVLLLDRPVLAPDRDASQRDFITDDITPACTALRFAAELPAHAGTALDVVKVNGASVPEEFKAIDHAPPGMAATDISNRMTADMRYATTSCTSVTWRGRTAIRQPVACITQQEDKPA